MTGWSVDVLGCADERDSRDIRCADVSELARVVGVATSLSKARIVHIRAIPDPDGPGDLPKPRVFEPVLHVHTGPIKAELDRLEAQTSMMPIQTVRRLLDDNTHAEPEPDPIETGREAALGQWEARWAALQATLKLTGTWGASHDLAFAEIERDLPVGLPVGERWTPRMAGRVTFQLEPERVTELVRLLDDIGTLKVHSLRTNSEAMNLSAEIKRTAEQQGWRP